MCTRAVFVLFVAAWLAIPAIGVAQAKADECAAAADPPIHGPAAGIYWMVSLPYSPEEAARTASTLAENDCLDGIFIRINWDDIEQSNGDYYWGDLDWAVKLAREHNLQYKVMLLPGMHTPAWVYEEGAEAFPTSFPWPLREEYGQPTKMPLPWDPVYQHYFRRMMEAFSDRYQEDEHFVAVTLTGVNFVYGEMHLPKSEADIEQWETYGNYAARIENLYKDLTDFYAQIFPQQQMVLHVTMPIPGMGENVHDIVRYGVKMYPERFTLQNAQLTGHSNNRRMFSYRVILEYEDRAHVGFQSLNSFTTFEERVGSFKVATYNFVKAGGEYWELLRPDGFDEAFVCTLAETVAHARAIGAEAYRRELERTGQFADAFAEQRRRMRAHKKAGEYDKAIAILNETFRFIYYDIKQKVELLQKAGRSGDAVDFLQSIIQRRNTAAFHDLLATVYTEIGAVDDAASSLEQAYQLSHNGRYLVRKGHLYADRGRRSDAIDVWLRFLNAQGRTQPAYERVAGLYRKYGFARALEALRAEAAQDGIKLAQQQP